MGLGLGFGLHLVSGAGWHLDLVLDEALLHLPTSPHISPYLPVSPRCERNPPHTAIHPAKWRALLPPDGSELELAPHGALATYLEAVHAAPDTQARLRPIERRSDGAIGR